MEVATYSEAKTEYLKQMTNRLTIPLLTYFQRMRAEVVAESKDKALSRFQTRCCEVPKWNQDVVADETNRLIDSSRCDYLEELMTALFIAHTKVMASIRITKKKKNRKLKITVPRLDHYLHRVYTECAKSFYKAPYLFNEQAPSIERQKNLEQAEKVIADAIDTAVRDMLPIKEILQEYIKDPAESEGESSGSDNGNDNDSSGESEDEAPKKKTEKKKAEKPIPKPPQPSIEEVKPEAPPVIELAPLIPPPVAPVEAIQAPVVAENDEKPVKVPIELSIMESPVREEAATTEKAVSVIKEDDTVAEKAQPEPEPESIKIITEPSVQFSEMVSVFDERTPHVSEMRSIENPMNKSAEDVYEEDDSELLHIGQELGGLDGDDIEDVEHPGLSNEISGVEEL